MSVPDITDDKVIRARYKIGGLGNNDSLDFSFPTHIDLGWAAGRSYERFHHDFSYVEYVVVAGIVALAAYLVVRRKRSSRLSNRASDPAG